jgi:hypothetical protein
LYYTKTELIKVIPLLPAITLPTHILFILRIQNQFRKFIPYTVHT